MVGNYARPAVVNAAAVPWEETFIRYPSLYLATTVGKKVEVRHENKSDSSQPLASNIFRFVVVKPNSNFNTNDYFDPVKNADNLATLRLCELDLTALPAGKPLLLHLAGWLGAVDSKDLSTARLRVKIDGEVKESVEGVREYQSTGYDQRWYYPLQGGGKHKVEIEFAGKGTNVCLPPGEQHGRGLGHGDLGGGASSRLGAPQCRPQARGGGKTKDGIHR